LTARAHPAPRPRPCAEQAHAIRADMHRLLVSAFLLTLVPALPATAQVGPLQSFTPLTGGTWVTDGQHSTLGQYHVERTHEFALDGLYLRVRQTMTLADGRTILEETLIGWDPGAQRYTLWGFSSDGSRTDALGLADGNRFVFAGKTYGLKTQDWRMTTLLIDDSSLSVLLEVRNGRDFAPALTLAFRRRMDDGTGG
jgi:hypothetical protein